MEPLLTLKGIDGNIELYEDRVQIKWHKGLSATLSYGFRKDKTIPISQINEVRAEKAADGKKGHIKFYTSDGNKRIQDPRGDNTVYFKFRENDTSELIQRRISELKEHINDMSQALEKISQTNDESRLLSLKGISADIELYEDKIVIKWHKGYLEAFAHGIRGEKTIYISDINAVQIKKATDSISGYIQFTIDGGNEGTRGIMEAANDENSVFFGTNENTTAELIRHKIDEIKKTYGSLNHMRIYSGQPSEADEILKFKSLLDEGIITPEEFEAKKRQLLGL